MTQPRQTTSDAQQGGSAGAKGSGTKSNSPASQRSGSSAETKSKTQEASSQAQEQIGKAAGQAQEQVGKLTGMAQEQVTSQLASQKTRAADKLSVVATALQDAGKQVRDKDEAQMADYIDAAAGQIDQIATALRDQDVMQLLRSAEQVARRQPELFLAATFALGFAATRFFRSSSAQSESDWSGSDRRSSYDGSSYRGMDSGYGSGAYGQGLARSGATDSWQESRGYASGYGGQINTGFGSDSGSGYGADMGPSQQSQRSSVSQAGARSGFGETRGTELRGDYAGAASSGGATDWPSGSNIGTRPEER